MKIFTYTFMLLLAISSCGQVKNNDGTKGDIAKNDSSQKVSPGISDYHPVFEKAHPKAQQLMRDSFFFSPIEETAPFGSDDGSDAYAGFRDWRKINPTQSPVNFVNHEIDYWKYPKFDLEETDFDKLKSYLKQDGLHIQYMTGIDEAIVATAFGQLYLEGKIDADIKALAKNAVKRELAPLILQKWGKSAKLREQKLNMLLSVLNTPGI